jgi:hypothetical protein
MAVAGAAAGVHRSKLLHALLSTCALAALVSLVATACCWRSRDLERQAA